MIFTGSECDGTRWVRKIFQQKNTCKLNIRADRFLFIVYFIMAFLKGNSHKRLNFIKKFICNEIPFKFLFSRDIYFVHPVGIVIASEVKIGKNVKIYSNVTIGNKSRKTSEYPIIGDDVIIFTGACIIGGINIGKGSIIGANTTVTKDVPPYSLVINKTELLIKDIS